MKQIYRCDTCGSERTRVEDAELLRTEHGPVVNIHLNCRHCRSINLLQIASVDGVVEMEVIGRAVPKYRSTNDIDFEDLEWP